MSDLEKKARIFSNTEGNQSSKLMREVEYDTGRYVGYLAGFKDCQKEYEEKLRWIPTEKELPKNYSAVLAVIKSPICTWVEEIGYCDGKFQLPGRGNTDFVTHWMYLPEPPPFL